MTSTTRTMTVLFPVLLVFIAAVSSGCGARQTWQFTLTSQDEKVVIDMPNVTLIFEGVSVPLLEGQTGGGASGSLGVAGPGTSKVTVTVFGKSFTNSYNNGVNTMTFEGHSLKLLNAGTKLKIGMQEIDLIGEKKTVVVHKDGSADVQKPD